MTGGVLADTVSCLAVHPVDASVVYAATDIGIHKSTDGGESWDNTGGGDGLGAVAVFPPAPDTVFAAGDDGAVMSPDGGTTWVDFGAGLDVSGVNCLAVGQRDGVRVYAGTRGAAAYVHEFPTGVVGGPGESCRRPAAVLPSVVRAGERAVVRIRFGLPVPVDAVLSLVDVTGRTVWESRADRTGEQSLDVGGLHPGVYFVRTGSRPTGAGQKLVVTR